MSEKTYGPQAKSTRYQDMVTLGLKKNGAKAGPTKLAGAAWDADDAESKLRSTIREIKALGNSDTTNSNRVMKAISKHASSELKFKKAMADLHIEMAKVKAKNKSSKTKSPSKFTELGLNKD